MCVLFLIHSCAHLINFLAKKKCYEILGIIEEFKKIKLRRVLEQS